MTYYLKLKKMVEKPSFLHLLKEDKISQYKNGLPLKITKDLNVNSIFN
jgi:hypothetical protein